MPHSHEPSVPPAHRIKDSEDYLTARAANPRTGLITPFTPLTPAMLKLQRAVFEDGPSDVAGSPSEVAPPQIHVPKRRGQPLISQENYVQPPLSGVRPYTNSPLRQCSGTSTDTLAGRLPMARPGPTVMQSAWPRSCQSNQASQGVRPALHPRLRDLRGQRLNASVEMSAASGSPEDSRQATTIHTAAPSSSTAQKGEDMGLRSLVQPDKQRIPGAREQQPSPNIFQTRMQDAPMANQGNRIHRKPVGPMPGLVQDASERSRVSSQAQATATQPVLPPKLIELSDKLPKLRLRTPSQAAVPRVGHLRIVSPSRQNLGAAQSSMVEVEGGLRSAATFINRCAAMSKILVVIIWRRVSSTPWALKAKEHLQVFSDESLTPEQRLAGLESLARLIGRVFVAIAALMAVYSLASAIKSALDMILAPLWLVIKVLSWLNG